MTRTIRVKTVAASTCVACLALGTAIAFAAPGDFDSSFDGDGITRSDFDGSEVADLAIQSDGKIVAVGTGETEGSTDDDETAAIGRYTTAGAPDPGFLGGAGVSGSGQYNSQPTRLTGVAVRPSGPIVTAGFKEPGGDEDNPVAVVAQHAGTGPFAGALTDASFAPPDGILDVTFAPGEVGVFEDVALVPASGDAIAAGGTLPPGGDVTFGIASVTSAGALESGFGDMGSGLRTASPATIVSGSTGGDQAFAVAVNSSDSSIVAAGSSDPITADTSDLSDVGVAFLNASGSVTNAEVIDIGGRDQALDVDIQSDGKVLLTGLTQELPGPGDFDHFVARLEGDGDLDPTFGGGDGIVQSPLLEGDDGASLTLLPDGRIVVVGESFIAGDWVVARYTAAGAPDTSFDGDGIRLYDFAPSTGNLEAVAAQTDGKLVVGGRIAGDWAVGRLLMADDPPPVATPPVATPPVATPAGVTPSITPAAPQRKKCKKGRKLKKGKCVKKKKKRRK
ncbi:MAG: hypothetical protein ACRDL6_01265 [Solirubrobacterales bacterium]